MMPHRADLGPKPLLGYTASILARVAEKRGDDAFLAACAADARCGAFAIGGELIVLRKTANGHDPLFRADEIRALAPVAETVFLGLVEEAGRFGIALEPEATKALKGRPDLLVIDLRSIAVQGLVGPDQLAPLAEAKALLAWHARHRFCANCGTPTEMAQAGWKRVCPGCNVEHFPRTDPVVIMLAVHGERCLLGRAGRFVQNMWSCLAGFIEPGESIEEAARRETLEEAGITCGRVTYFASQPWPFPMSLMIGCHAQATSTDITVDREELEDARWFTRDEVALMFKGEHPEGISIPPPIAIAHHIIRAWVEDGDGVFD
jgi:NAD+ diphosphatase